MLAQVAMCTHVPLQKTALGSILSCRQLLLLLLQSLVATSTPADPIEAVQMLERQRHRARSGGGDLPASISLKRTPASKKEKEPSMLGQAGNSPAAAAAATAGSAADGHGDVRSGSFGSLAALSGGGGEGLEGYAAKSDVEKGPSNFGECSAAVECLQMCLCRTSVRLFTSVERCVMSGYPNHGDAGACRARFHQLGESR